MMITNFFKKLNANNSFYLIFIIVLFVYIIVVFMLIVIKSINIEWYIFELVGEGNEIIINSGSDIVFKASQAPFLFLNKYGVLTQITKEEIETYKRKPTETLYDKFKSGMVNVEKEVEVESFKMKIPKDFDVSFHNFKAVLLDGEDFYFLLLGEQSIKNYEKKLEISMLKKLKTYDSDLFFKYMFKNITLKEYENEYIKNNKNMPCEDIIGEFYQQQMPTRIMVKLWCQALELRLDVLRKILQANIQEVMKKNTYIKLIFKNLYNLEEGEKDKNIQSIKDIFYHNF